MPSAHRLYFNRLAPEWHLKMPEDPSIEDHLRTFGIRSGDRVLDVGSGSGRLARSLARLVGNEGLVVAEDIAEKMLLQGRSLTLEPVLWLCDDVHNLSLRDGSFTKVVCFSAFPHFVDSRAALLEMRRALIPGGEILIFHLDSSRGLNEFHSSLEEPVRHDKLPDTEQMRILLLETGFQGIRILDTESLYWAQAVRPLNPARPG